MPEEQRGREEHSRAAQIPKSLSGRNWRHRGDSLPRSQRARDPEYIVLWDTEQSRGKAGNESQELLLYTVY